MRNLIAALTCLIALSASGSASAADPKAEPANPAPAAEPAAPADVTAAPAADPNAAPADASAEPETTAEKKGEWAIPDRGAFLAGVKVGGFVTYTSLRGNARVVAEVGYVLPFLDGMFAVQAELGYAEPRKFGIQGDDPRVPGGAYHYTLVQQQLTVMPTVVARLPWFGRFVPYLGVGARVYMLQSTTRGETSGVDILNTKEQDTKVGVGIPIGVQIGLGPGHLTVEVLTEWGPLEHTATGPSNTGAESLQLGYRFLL